MMKTARSALFFAGSFLAACFCSSCGDDAPPPPPPAEQTADDTLGSGIGSGAVAPASGPVILASPDAISGLGFSAETSDAVPSTASQTPVARVEVENDTIHRVTEAQAEVQQVIRQPKRTTWNVEGKISADSLAAQLAEAAENPDGTRILWTPQTVSGSLALTRIPCVILSADASLLIFLETTGKPEGPFGSRLILMSAEDWSVIKIVDLPDRYLKKLAFVPGTLKIAALCAAQKECKQVAGVLCLDLQSGKEDRFQQTETGIGERTFLVDSNRNLIVSHPKRAELLVLPLERQQNHVIKVAAADAVAALSPDGKEIAVIGPAHAGQIEIFRTTDWLPAATVSVEKTTRVAKIQFLRGNKAFLLCGDPAFSANSVIVRPGNTIELDGLASGMALTPGNGKKIYHLTGNNNEIQELDSSSGMLYRTILTDRAEPRFARPGPGPGTVQHFFYIPFCNGLAMLDSNGNFFLIPADRTENYKGKNDERAVIFQCKGL